MKQPHKPHRPHQLPQRDPERCAVEGHCIEGGSLYTVTAIRDRKRRGWVLYARGAATPGVLITEEAARTLAHHMGHFS